MEQEQNEEYQVEELNSGNETLAFKVIPMPPDGSCFYHCILAACSGQPFFEDKIRQCIQRTFETPKTKENGITFERVKVLRMLVAQSLTEEDFENYNIMAIAEDATPCQSLRQLKGLVTLTNEYANMVIINALVRLFGKSLGIVILVNGEVTSDDIWMEGYDNYVFLKLHGYHYDLYQFYDKQAQRPYPYLITNKQMEQWDIAV
jgi:hypothetical protein